MFIVTELACGGDLLALLLSEREVGVHDTSGMPTSGGVANAAALVIRVSVLRKSVSCGKMCGGRLQH